MSAKAWASKRRQLASRNRPTHPTAERAALDQAAGEENVVKGTSTVSISIKERAQQWKNMKSILKKTKIARKSQMEEASDGPTSSGDDGGSSDDSAEAKT
jgi:predicted nucleic acid-binding Zn ribbon protein